MEKRKHWVKELLVRVLPIWQGHVELACELTEQAIDNLACKFSVIVSKLERKQESKLIDGQCSQTKKDAIAGSIQQLKQLIAQGKNEECLDHLQRMEEYTAGLIEAYEQHIKSFQQLNDEIKSQHDYFTKTNVTR